MARNNSVMAEKHLRAKKWAIKEMKVMQQMDIIAERYRPHKSNFQESYIPYSVYGAVSKPHVVA